MKTKKIYPCVQGLKSHDWEYFQSLEVKGKGSFKCKRCKAYGIIFPLDNEDKFDDEEKLK